MAAIGPIVTALSIAVPPARAQQPASAQVTASPEARAAIEAWDTADFYTRNGQPDKAAPYLESFQKSPPVQLWAAVDYYIRRNQPDKAVPYLTQLMKIRPDPATVLALRDRFGLESFERLYQDRSTRPFAGPLNNLLAAAKPRPNFMPGPELFAREPRTPVELWEAIDYLIRTGQAAKAVPYLTRLQQARPDDATWVAIRDRFGVGSFMRLDEDPATRPFAQPMTAALAEAARRYATRPDRLARFVADLTLTPEEQSYAVRRLWEAGPYAVPPLVQALQRPGLARGDHDLLVRNMGRLQPSAVPPLTAALESPDPGPAADAATALGSIGDASAVPFLTFSAASPSANPAVRTAAQAAIERLTGRPFAQQPAPPVRVLTDAAWWYHRNRPGVPDELVTLWSWDPARKAPVPRQVTPDEARAALGLLFAGKALRLDPNDRSAQVAQLSLVLERAARRAGPEAVPAQDPAAFAAATAAGPALLAQVLEAAIADGKPDLAAATVLALARVTDRAALLGATGRPHPLVRALSAPGRRTQLLAARAIVALAPDRPFLGSSLVAPTLARFVTNQPQPRAVVIDHNPSRGSLLASSLMSLGYVAEVEPTGREGFLAAADPADAELVLIAYDLHRGDWMLSDTLANLRADARTAALPIYLYGPYDLRFARPNLERDFPGIRFMVPAGDPALMERQIGGRPSALTAAERVAYAREAAALLARIAADRRGPLAAGLRTIEPALAVAVRVPETAGSAAAALAELPDPGAQRDLYSVAVDPSRPADLRAQAARLVAASIRRFGPLLTRDQESRLAATLNEEPDFAIRQALVDVIAALSPRRPATGGRAPAAPAAAPDAPRPQPGATP